MLYYRYHVFFHYRPLDEPGAPLGLGIDGWPGFGTPVARLYMETSGLVLS